MSAAPQFIVIGGFAGSGKSTLARRLGSELQLPVFEIDQMAFVIRESDGFSDSALNPYHVAFDLFFSLARSILQSGCGLIFDQNMGHSQTWKNIERLTEELTNINLQIFLLNCPFDVCCKRVERRHEHPNLHQVTAAVLIDHKYKWDFLEENELPLARRVDATLPKQTVFDEVFANIKESGPTKM